MTEQEGPEHSPAERGATTAARVGPVSGPPATSGDPAAGDPVTVVPEPVEPAADGAADAVPAPRSGAFAVARLLGTVAVVLAVSAAFGKLAVALVLFAVVVMVMVHELGHFAVAKWSGMKVTEYFLGFGPRVWSIRRGETEYGVKAIPAGGYVRIIGMSNLEEVAPQDEQRTYRRQPFWQRVAVASAGSFMHAVMAFALLFSALALIGPPTPSLRIATLAQLKDVQNPAAAGGMKPGDRLVAVDGRALASFEELSGIVRDRVGVPIPVAVDRDGQRLQLTVVPLDRRAVKLPDGSSLDADPPTVPTGFLGVTSTMEHERLGPVTAFGRTASQMWDGARVVVRSLGSIFSPSGITTYLHTLAGDVPKGKEQQAQENRFISPIGLASIADDAVADGIWSVLMLLYGINLFVGIFNMIPLLPFDGGHVAVATYEKLRSLRGRRHMVDFAKLVPISYAVIAILMFISLSSIWLDLVDPITSRN